MDELFERVTEDELENYAREGTLPEWVSNMVGPTTNDIAERASGS